MIYDRRDYATEHAQSSNAHIAELEEALKAKDTVHGKLMARIKQLENFIAKHKLSFPGEQK